MRTIEARPGKLDVHFSVDTTGSFGDEIDRLQAELDGVIVPSLEERVEDVAFGVSRFEDFPAAPYGRENDRPFELLAPITTSRSRVSAGVAQLDQPFGNGADAPESGFEALYQIATGEGYELGRAEIIAPYRGDGEGGVGFRESSLRVVVHVTDATAHQPADYGSDFPGTRGFGDAVRALTDLDVRVLGIASESTARPHLEALAIATGGAVAADSPCETGIDGAVRDPVDEVCPLVFDIAEDGAGLSGAIVDAIVGLLDSVQYEEVHGEAVDDGLRFVRGIEAVEATPPPGVSAPTIADLRDDPLGVDDTFLDVALGTELRFAIRLRNVTVLPASYDQYFHLRVQILGDGLVLDEVTIRVVVPAGRLDAGVVEVDAGAGDAGTRDAGMGGDSGPAGDSDGGPVDAGPVDAG